MIITRSVFDDDPIKSASVFTGFGWARDKMPKILRTYQVDEVCLRSRCFGFVNPADVTVLEPFKVSIQILPTL